MKNLWALLCRMCKQFMRPSTRIGLGVLVAGGFVAGIISWQAVTTGMNTTNEEWFCLNCHTMRDNVLPELQKTVHWSNRTGVRARCPDCHVPHEFTSKWGRKMQASNDLLKHLTGSIDNREKFLENRLMLAQREWKRFAANSSKECRNCHDYKDMNFDKMRPTSQVMMRQAAERNQSCLDCHKGIAHHLPDVKGAHNPAFDTLTSEASSTSVKTGGKYVAALPIDFFRDEAMKEKIGNLEIATPVTVLETKGNAVQVELDLWRKNKGYGRVWYGEFGLNIVNAVFDKEAAGDQNLVKVNASKEDEMTGLEWQKVTARVWLEKGHLISSAEPIWNIARSSYSTSCSVCHRQPDEGHHDTNSWPGLFGGMVGFTNLDPDTAKVVLKYLQTHSSDFSRTKTQAAK